jgi:hypothetical protein
MNGRRLTLAERRGRQWSFFSYTAVAEFAVAADTPGDTAACGGAVSMNQAVGVAGVSSTASAQAGRIDFQGQGQLAVRYATRMFAKRAHGYQEQG